MGAWARLASRAAFRNGKAVYCGHINEVTLGSWAGGIVGLKSILSVKRRQQALELMDKLSAAGYIEYAIDAKTKKLTYQIKDWVVSCSGAPCMGREAVYATEGYGFLCLPRNITQRLAEAHYCFDESDAWLDLWCHTVWQEQSNAFSHMAPAVQFGRHGAILTLESLGRRWGWEKTKVWRFFRKHADAFPLYKLPGSFGCLILNTAYPTGMPFTMPTMEEVIRILDEIRIAGEHTHFNRRDLNGHERLTRLVAWCSQGIIVRHFSAGAAAPEPECRVAPWCSNNTHAYFSLRNCENFNKDCQGKVTFTPGIESLSRTVPKTGPPHDPGGFEHGKFEGIPLW